jgi:hypothetical protein
LSPCTSRFQLPVIKRGQPLVLLAADRCQVILELDAYYPVAAAREGHRSPVIETTSSNNSSG